MVVRDSPVAAAAVGPDALGRRRDAVRAGVLVALADQPQPPAAAAPWSCERDAVIARWTPSAE
jgi:hypothetical protein